MSNLPQVMPTTQDFTFDDIVRIDDGQPMTTSMKVAEVFGKRHTHVLDKIKNLDCSPEFSSANFSAHVQIIEIGKGATRESKYYTMTKDGFIFLVMGFTGEKAAQFKEMYISAFNWLSEKLLMTGIGLMKRHNYLTLMRKQEANHVSNAGRAMRYWQDTKPEIDGELADIEEKLNPQLDLKVLTDEGDAA